MSTFTIKQGDYHRRIALDLTDITTTGAIGVTFRMRPRGGGGLVVDAAGVIDTATRVSYQFTGTQLDTPGIYDLEAALAYADGTETVPTASYVSVVVVARLS
jgi:hypothetical protein